MDDAVLRAVELIQALQHANTDLKSNFAELKGWYEELATAHQALKDQYVQLQKDRDTVEHQYQFLCDGWRMELDSKQAAFESLRAEIQSQRDVEVIRLRLLEEVERPYRAKCDVLRQEAEAAQTKFVALRRELNALQSKAEARILHLEHQVANDAAQHTAEREALQSRLASAESTAAALQKTMRSAQQSVREREHHLTKIRHLTAELDDVAAEKAAADARRRAAAKDCEERLARMHAAQLEAQHALSTVQARARSLETEVAHLESTNKHLVGQATSAQDAAHGAAVALAAAKQASEDEARTAQSALEASEAASAEALSRAAEEAAHANKLLDSQLLATRTELEHLRSEVASKVAVAEEALRSQIATLEAELRAEKAACMTEKQSRKHDDAAARQHMHALESQVQELRGDCTEAHAETRRVRDECSELLREAGELKAGLEREAAQAQHAVEAAETARRQAESAEAKMAEALTKADKSDQAAQASKALAADLRKQLNEQAREFEDKTSSAKQTWVVAKSLALKRLQASAKATQHALELDLQKWRKTAMRQQKELAALKDEKEALEWKLLEGQHSQASQAPVGGTPQNQPAASTSSQFQTIKGRIAALKQRQQAFLTSAPVVAVQ